MLIPLKYNVRYLITRWKTTCVTAGTFALVVATFIIVMSLAQGIDRALTSTGDPLNVIVMRAGVQADSQSEITMDQFEIARNMSGVAKNADGNPLAAPEVLTLVNKPRKNGNPSNLQVRGVHQDAFVMRSAVKIVEGRKFQPGLREAIVSRSVANRFKGFGLGDEPRLGRGTFKIVGIFEAQASAYESEVWVDYKELMQEFDRRRYSTVVLRAEDAAAVKRMQAFVDNDRRLKLVAKDEVQYYSEQTRTAKPVRAFAFFLAFTMAIGACFAGMNTMYANVANRVREIGTLRILGFRPTAVLVSFMIESVCLALIGGALGCALSLPMNGYATGTTNFDSFSEIIFYFTITPGLLMRGMMFSAAMGLVGGFLPAYSASKQPILAALRQL